MSNNQSAAKKNGRRASITVIPYKSVSQAINYILEDRADLGWLVAVGRDSKGDIYFYDTGGDITEDLGVLEYLKQRIARAHFAEDDAS